MSTATCTVTGMTCGHCVSSVTGWKSLLDGLELPDPDEFLLDQWDLDPHVASHVLQDIVAARRTPTVTLYDVLDQLRRGGASRFADRVARTLTT